MVKKECCSKCGFPLDFLRKPVLLDCNILSYLHYEHNTCEECGHQKDGSTIPIVHNLIQELCNKYIDERKRLIKFIHYYHFLTDEQRKEVCLSMPRFMKENYESKGNQEEDDIEEPYSWSVVFLEVINNTKLSRAMLNNIDWENLNSRG